MFPLRSVADPYGTLSEYVDLTVFLPASLEKKDWDKKMEGETET